MPKKLPRTKKRDTQRAAIISETAALVGVSSRYVRMVLAGERENDRVMAVFMELTEGFNALLNEVEKLVPFKK